MINKQIVSLSEIKNKLKHTPFSFEINTVYYIDFSESSKNLPQAVITNIKERLLEKQYAYMSLLDTIASDALLKITQYYLPFIDFSTYNTANLNLANTLKALLNVTQNLSETLFYVDKQNGYLFSIDKQQDVGAFFKNKIGVF